VDRITGTSEARRQLLEPLLARWAARSVGIEGRGHLADLGDILSDRHLFGRDLIQAAVDAAG
jgi:hypothetical protein